jgi:PAS domain S-box-containing protein
MEYVGSATTLIPVPSDDLVLGSLANRVLAPDGRTPLALERALRPAFPYVSVRIQHELAQIGFKRAWYVYRDGQYQLRLPPEWWRQEGLAHVALDQSDRILEVDDPATRLFGLSRKELVGTTEGHFFASELRSRFADVMSMLRDRRILQTRWLLYRPDGVAKYAEFRFVRDGPPAQRQTAVMMEVPSDELILPKANVLRMHEAA